MINISFMILLARLPQKKHNYFRHNNNNKMIMIIVDCVRPKTRWSVILSVDAQILLKQNINIDMIKWLQQLTGVLYIRKKQHNLLHTEKWYGHRADPVTENDTVKLLWGFNIQTDKVIEARRIDLVLIYKDYRQQFQETPGQRRKKKRKRNIESWDLSFEGCGTPNPK